MRDLCGNAKTSILSMGGDPVAKSDKWMIPEALFLSHDRIMVGEEMQVAIKELS